MQPPAPFAPYPHPAYRQPPAEEPPPRLRPLQAITFAFRGEESLVSILIGVVYLMIPVVGSIAFAGYQTEIFRRLVRRDPRPLPKLTFTPFMAYLGRGIVPWLAQIFVTLPFGILGGTVFLVVMLSSAVGATHGTGGGAPPSAMMAMMFLPWLGMMAAWLALYPVLQIVLTRAALTEDLARTFDPHALVAYTRKTWWALVAALVVYGALAIGLHVLGIAMCFVGVWPVTIIVQIAATHLRWQTYELYLARGGEPVAMKPEPALPQQQATWAAPG
jgi:hypothetical protein